MTDLKPCPFCGGEAYLNSDNMEGYNYLRCDSCEIEQRVFAGKKEAIKEWNTRTLDIESYEAGRRDAQAEIDAACAECEAQQERALEEAQKERTCTATFILKGRPNYLLSLYSCSSCGVSWHIEPSRKPNYCPNCGAKVVDE